MAATRTLTLEPAREFQENTGVAAYGLILRFGSGATDNPAGVQAVMIVRPNHGFVCDAVLCGGRIGLK